MGLKTQGLNGLKVQIKVQSCCMLLAIVFVLTIVLPSGSAFAATTIEVAPASSEAYAVIQKQLNIAKKEATSSNPYTIKVAKGSYTLAHGLRLYSNTTLDLTGCVLRATPGATHNIVRIGNTPDKNSGYYYRNIAIVGGTLDGGYRSNTVVKLAHAKNVVLKNVVVKNVRNGHLVEVAGVANMTVSGCTFRNQEQSAGVPYIPEAFQIDILEQRHMPQYQPEDLPVKNLTIDSCKFADVCRGVGAHTAVMNRWTKGVTITNNLFARLRSDAIRTMWFRDCRIEGNTITKAPRGIAVHVGKNTGMYFASTLAKQGGVPSEVASEYKAPVKKQNIIIRNNVIGVSGTDIYNGGPCEGILLSGMNAAARLKATSENDAAPKGNYFASGITVTGNTIKTNGNGIRLVDAKNCSIVGNKIVYVGSRSSSGYRYGICLYTQSTSNTIKSNAITSAKSHGVLVASGSSASVVSRNSISSPGAYGISIQNGTVTTMKANKISGSASSGISVLSKGRIANLCGNVVASAGESAIYVSSSAMVGKIKANRLKAPNKNGILIHDGAKVTWIKGNKIAESRKTGVRVEDATVSYIVSNRISSSKGAGIFAGSGARLLKIKNNIVRSGGGYGIAVKIVDWPLAIVSNTVSRCKNYGIYVHAKNSTSLITIRSNKLSGGAKARLVKVGAGKVNVRGSKVAV